MDILCIMTIYNEIDFLPYKVEWCHKNGLNLYIIDNYSTDGSYQWLKNHNIDCHQINTKEAFDLDALQEEIIKTVDKIKPDWVVYNGADLFIFAEKPIVNLCKDAEKTNSNIITFPQINMCNTGEDGSVLDYFYYIDRIRTISFIFKWNPGIKYNGDTIIMSHKKRCYFPGIMINYGFTKAPEKRKELLKRRRLAWSRGLSKVYGTHYIEEEKRNYKWDRNELKDIRKSEYWDYLKPYQI